MNIDSYAFGQIVIDGQRYTKDVIIFPTRVYSPWWRREGHRLHREDLSEVFAEKPDVLIIGRGYSGVMEVSERLVRELEAEGLEVIVERTTEAVNRFREYAGGNVAAALHLTC